MSDIPPQYSVVPDLQQHELRRRSTKLRCPKSCRRLPQTLGDVLPRLFGILLYVGGMLSGPGCAVPDAIFNVLGNSYSGGGLTREEKKYHYERRLRALNEDAR